MRPTLALVCSIAALFISNARAQVPPPPPHDPGVQLSARAVGVPLTGLTKDELRMFTAGQTEFVEVEEVDEGLGPTMNLDSCAGCHLQPAIGGSSPRPPAPKTATDPGSLGNPQVGFAIKNGATNTLPSFIKLDGPILEARFKTDGGVHALFTIAGRTDAPGCSKLPQPVLATALTNVVFRIPTPTFGAGLIEAIPEATILANKASDPIRKMASGIVGKENRNGNDGTITRFGWKAQNKSLLLFSGEAYNVEMGITNELFQNERDETSGCQFAPGPNSVTNLNDPPTSSADRVLSAIEKFAMFMRFLAPPPVASSPVGGMPSYTRGAQLFSAVGCNLCHTPTLMTGPSTVAALSNKPANLYSDLLLHNMGTGLADGIKQGAATGYDFRTAPLWGLGQRVLFLHDGRTSDLLAAIQAHYSPASGAIPGSEANQVTQAFIALTPDQKQDILNFLRSL